jgi:histidinol-phosphate aminotransferase
MKYWNTCLKKMTEYVPGEQPQNLEEYIKLNTNENPFPPSAKVIEAIRSETGEILRRYPSANADKVREVFASMNGLAKDNVFVANGSDEIFTLLFRGFIDKNELAAFCYPSYALYYTMAEANDIPYEKVQLTKDFDVPFSKLLAKKYRLIIICNPNNPTGKGIPVEDIRNFLAKYKGLLVVDEAYVDFYNETAIELVKDHDNLIITRSLSKSYSLAGLRVGLAIANKEIIDGFLKLKDSYNVDRLAAAGAYAALLDQKTFKYTTEMVRNNKEYLEDALAEIGFESVPSKSNFIFTRHPDIPSEDLYKKLKERKIIIRHYTGPVQENYVRITVGTMLENKALIKAIRAILEESK